MAVTGLRIRKIKPGGAAVIGLFFLFAVFSWARRLVIISLLI